VNSGAVIDGVTYDTPLTVALGTGDPVVIERSVTPFTIAEGSTTTLIFDLNTELWLNADVISAGAGGAADIQNSTNVIIR
jgi:hypothetical protein